jgi:hypothetical protein
MSHIIRIPIARWWRLIQPPVPQRISIRREEDPGGRDRALLFVEGRPAGYISPFAVGHWLYTIFQELPTIMTTTEELAVHRALVLSALRRADPSSAQRIALELGVALDATDVIYGVGDSAEISLWHMSDDEPFDPG